MDRFLSLGLDAKLLVPEERDISLPERCRSDRWCDATGWCAYTTRGNTNADPLASCLYAAVQATLPGKRLRTDYTDGAPKGHKRPGAAVSARPSVPVSRFP